MTEQNTPDDAAVQAVAAEISRLVWRTLPPKEIEAVARAAVEAARPIIEADTLTKAADVIAADDFAADDLGYHDPDYWVGLVEAASYLRRTAARTEPEQPQHNHPDTKYAIKPLGECPGCDSWHNLGTEPDA